MPTFKGKDGKDSYHMNPQAGKSLRGSSDIVKTGGQGPEKPHEAGGHDGHMFNGEAKAHHVEIHHGGHEHGQPPDDGAMKHHTISYGEDGGQDVRNHANMEEAKEHIGNAMHDGCPECDPAGDHGEGMEQQVGGSTSEGAM